MTPSRPDPAGVLPDFIPCEYCGRNCRFHAWITYPEPKRLAVWSCPECVTKFGFPRFR
jgi:hypothetical protein